MIVLIIKIKNLDICICMADLFHCTAETNTPFKKIYMKSVDECMFFSLTFDFNLIFTISVTIPLYCK